MLSKITKYLWLIPVFFAFGLIVHFGVNIPFGDDWSNVTVYNQIDDGKIPAKELWQQHNEHRIFFPTTLSTSIAYLSHGNLKVQMIVSLALAVMSFLLLYSVMKEYSLLLALWWFSPIQAENWLWGFEICWFLCVLAVIWSFKQLSKKKANIRNAVIGGVVASFSAAIGLLVWPVGLIILYFNKQPKKWWIISAVVTSLVYFFHYMRPASGGSLQALSFGKYFLALLGGSVTTSPDAAVLAGGILLSLLVPLSYLVYKDKFRKGHFWIALILFSLLAMSMTASGRNASGITQALSSRYTSFTLIYIVGVMGLAFALTKQAGVRWLAIGLSIPLLISSYLSGIENMKSLHTDRIIIKACSNVAKPDEACIKLVNCCDSPALTQKRIDYLKTKHWGGY